MALSTTKRFTPRAKEFYAFYNEDGEARVNIEGTVSIADEDLVANVNVDSSSASYGGTYIGKATAANSEDFNVAYTSGTTVTFSNYPSGITAFHADDIELVRQIDTDGAVVESYTRDDATMSITGNVLTVSGADFGATDTFVVLTNVASGGSAASGSSVGGGNNTYSNASGDFIATITDATSNITITGLSFTLEDINVVMGAIKKITAAGVVTNVDLSDVVVAGSVITVENEPAFATGEVVVVSLIGPDKAYDVDLDSAIGTVLNPEYAPYTSVEALVSETNLGFTGGASVADGTSSATQLNDDSETTWTNAIVAVGYDAYSEEEDLAVGVVSVDAVDLVTTATIAAGSGDGDWLGDTWWLPECKRFVIPSEGYNYLTIHTRLATTGAGNTAYCKIYGTLDADADDTDDTYWVDLSTDIFGAAQLSCTGASGTQEGIYFVNSPTVVLKYMIKIVGEVSAGAGGAIAANAFDVYIKKSS